MHNNALHLVVTPAGRLTDTSPPVLLTTTAFKVGGTLIVKADASSPDMDITEMLVAMCEQLLPPKRIAALAAKHADAPA